MPDDRTTVTELATALGTLGVDELPAVLAERPVEVQISAPTWARLEHLHGSGRFAAEFHSAYENGRAFFTSQDGLRGRRPQLVEWTGGRRLLGDDIAPIDIRIDHVFQISCKYLSSNLSNTSPARLFDGLLVGVGTWDRSDWYAKTTPDLHRDLYSACRAALELDGLPADPCDMSREERRQISAALRGKYPQSARGAYAALCTEVSEASACRWRDRINSAGPGMAERMLWRLLRISNAPYFVLGVDISQLLRVRVASPWDWRRAFEFLSLEIAAATAGQPQVNWVGRYRVRETGERLSVRGRVEIRWSHGRFRQPPEAKIYLETPVTQLPGYFRLR